MDLKQLQCFRAVMATGAMTRAAASLGVSQPTISATIGGLERELGFLLFERSKGTLRPTPEAYYFYEETLQVIERLDRAVQVAREIRRSNHGEITLLTYPGIALRFLPRLIDEFRSERPDVRFKLVSRNSDSLRRLIPAGQFSLAIVEVPAIGEIESEVIALNCLCAVPAASALAGKRTITPRDLDGVPFFGLFQDHATWHQLAAAFSRAGARWNLVVECQFFASAAALVAGGRGCAVLDPITASELQFDDIVLRPFEPAIRYEIAILKPTQLAAGQLTDAFLTMVRQHLTALAVSAPGA